MKKSTARFLASMNAMNNSIAAREAEETQPKTDVDAVRLQRDAERRERLGTLRAREHPGKRPHRAYNVFGYIDLSKE